MTLLIVLSSVLVGFVCAFAVSSAFVTGLILWCKWNGRDEEDKT